MAIGVLYDSNTITQEQYDRIIELLQGKLAQGRIFHMAGPKEGGGWRVVDVFESPAAFETFAQMLVPIVQQAGAEPPQITVWPLHKILEGSEHHL
jgi:hypothetical protein